MLRISSFFNSSNIFIIIISIAILGGRLLSIVCLSQRDMKVVIAYSSVVHIALIISSIISMFFWGFEGAIIIIIAHGVCSSGIFARANIIYDKSHSRRYILNKGYLNASPSFSLFWFILIVANFGGPFTYNLIGEIVLINNITQIIKFRLIILCGLSLFSAGYRIILYSNTQQGQIFDKINFSKKIDIIRFNVLVSHIWPLIFLSLTPRFV